MNGEEVPVQSLDLKDNPEILSPPAIKGPLYRCATAVTVIGFVRHADLDLEIDGSVVSSKPGGFPEPDGYTFRPLDPLEEGQVLRARQWRDGMPSGWSSSVTVRDHQEDYPTGLPRPEINPAPVFQCGARTGVDNLITGSNVWIEADRVEVGRVDGAKDHQGVNVNPDYGPNQTVYAFADLCDESTPHSLQHLTGVPPDPLPTPAIDDTYDQGEQIRITNLVNGARFVLERNGSALGTWRTWGHAHLVGLSPELSENEDLLVRQRMCPGSESDPGETTVRPCHELPAPVVAPIQAGDTHIRIIEFVPDATIKVFAGLDKIGEGGGALVQLIRPVVKGETIYVIQSVGDCEGQTARHLEVQCVAPPLSYNPAHRNLFPIGQFEYDEDDLRGLVYYPAEDDGENQPFRRRVAEAGPSPIVFIAHGNHAIYYNPADREEEECYDPGGWVEIPNYRGYTYLQEQLARMGIISVSIDCNATNCTFYTYSNIEDRAELISKTVDFFKNSGSSQLDIVKDLFDLDRAALIGHSRGGEAVIKSGNDGPGAIGVRFRAVISLAPTDARLDSLGSSLIPADYPFMTILPAGDGDVRGNDGAKFYDTQRPSPFKSQVYIHNSCHNYFNREWPRNEGVPEAQIISRVAHERMLSAYGIAFLRAFLLEHDTLGFLTYNLIPVSVDTEYVHLSFELADQLTVDDHEQANTIDKNSLDANTQQISGMDAEEYRFSQITGPISQYNSSFYGNTIGMVAQSQERNGVFRSELNGHGAPDIGAEVWIRAAEVFTGGSLPSGATGFELGLEDEKGTIVWIDSDAVGGLPRPYERHSVMKTMLKTLRFPIACFRESNSEFDVDTLKAILLRCNRDDQRPLAFDMLQIVHR
jgi:hypothetical protein